MENTLEVTVCLVMALIGILLVSMASQPPIKIEKLSEEFLGDKVQLTGFINSKYVRSNHVFMKLGEDKVVIFESAAKKMQINPYFLLKNQKITVIGEVVEYDGLLELIAEEVLI